METDGPVISMGTVLPFGVKYKCGMEVRLEEVWFYRKDPSPSYTP